MTSSQDQPLTRRELRELERVREQQAAAATPPADVPQPPYVAVPAPAPTPAPQPAPAYPQPSAPTYASPQPVQPAGPQPGAPQPVAPAPQPVAPQRVAPQPTPSYSAPAPAQTAPVQSTPVQPASAPVPTFAPRSAGVATPQTSPFGGPIAAPESAPVADAEPLAPIPSAFAPRETPQAWSRPASPSEPAAPPAPASAPAAPAAAAPVAPAAPSGAGSRTPERTLTRRELRALIDQSEIDEHEDDADLTFDDLFGDSEASPSGAPAAATSAPAAPAQRPVAPTQAQPPAQPTAAPQTAPPAAAPGPLRQATPPPAATGSTETSGFSKPIGHWTSQLEQPVDRPEPFDQLLSRGGHGVPTTTNALILPSLPSQGGIGQSLTGGSELIVTGSIELPRTFGATGLHPSHIDSSDVDRLFEQVEDVAGTGVAPVAATSAISTQSAARAVMAPPKKEGLNAPLILAITAGVLALGVVTTLVIGVVAGLF